MMRAAGISRQGIVNGLSGLLERGMIGREKDGDSFNYWIEFDGEMPRNGGDVPVNPIDQASQPSLPLPVNSVDYPLVNPVDPNKQRGINKQNKPPLSRGDCARMGKPDLEAVKEQGLKIGLPPGECERFLDYYEANGWRVGKNPMKHWPSALANWKRGWMERGGHVNGNGTPTPRPQSVFELREIIKAKESQCVELRLKHCSEVAMGDSWTDAAARKKYFDMKKEIKQLNGRIAANA